MGHFFSKATVLLGSAVLLFYMYGINIKTTATALLAMIVGMLYDLPRGLGERGMQLFSTLCALAYGIFFGAGIFCPQASAMAAFIVYDAVRCKVRWPLGVWLFSAVWRLMAGEVMAGVYSLMLVLFATELAVCNMRNERLEEARLRQRDTSVENELLAKQRNRELIEKQNADIYLATLQERNRIAREIHDNVGHLLTRSILQVGAIKVINQSEALKDTLEELHETLNAAMTSMRNSVHDLHDESVDLRAAIEKTTADLKDFQVRIDYDMGPVIPREIKYAFIAITKEATSNAIRYSDGDCVTIIVREHPGFYQLMISDNGSAGRESGGTDEKLSGGMGLKNMRERVAALNGTIQISDENGFRIFVSIMKNEERQL